MRDLLSVLVEPNRRRLLELLLGGEQSVSALVAQVDITQSAVSQHLSVLSRAGLVQVRKEGRFRYYALRPQGLAELRASLDRFWSKEMTELAAARPPQRKGATMGLEKSVIVPLEADETFALLTEPDRLRRWQAITARIELRAGGTYRWTIVPGHTAQGNVIEVEPGRRLVLTWGWEDDTDLPPGTSTVTVTLEPVTGGTLVTLLHEGLTEEQATGHAEGWDHYFERLVSTARDGDAGADEWVGSPDATDKLAIAEASLAACQHVLRSVSSKDADASTPCKNFSVSELVDHLLGSIVRLGAMAGASVPSATKGEFEARVADAAQATLEAWRSRGVDGEVTSGDRPVPAILFANILSLEFLVHAWDFARATGQAVDVSDDIGAAVLAIGKEVIAPPMRDGDNFAAEVAVGPDAGNLERLVAFTGREP